MQWDVKILGGLSLERGGETITRFESRRVGALLALLALHAGRAFPREEVVDALWPDAEPNAGRHRLRQALTALRRQIEPPGVAHGAILVADRHTVRLNAAAVRCDAVQFEKSARSGQTQDARALYLGELLPGFYDEWILTERARLDALFDALPDDASFVTPPQSQPIETCDTLRLPAPLTAFVGREDELDAARARLAEARLLTLTGLGGSGKTRFALELARRGASDFDVLAFVPLADCAAPARVADFVRIALGLPAAPDSSALEQIGLVLSERRALLILDNFEHLVAAGGADAVTPLLSLLPRLTCLVTSRRLLGVPGECEFPIAPFPLPAQTLTLSELARSPAIALFVNRAQAVRPGFRATEKNRADLVALCRALEGVPLAIELAAARLRALSPAEMRAQIEARFDWLVRTGPGADKEPRHRSLRAALEWSWRLLTPAQQKFLASLCVFHGGWTATAAANVTETSDARERLESLTMDSLISSTAEAEGGTTRFFMLESVRAFAQEQQSEPEAAAGRARHREFFRKLAVTKNEAWQADAENLTAALETALEDGDTSAAFDLILALDDGWLGILGVTPALNAIRRALELATGAPLARVQTNVLAAHLALLVGDEPDTYGRDALQAAGEDKAARAHALLAAARLGTARYESPSVIGETLTEALNLAKESEQNGVAGDCLRLLGLRAARLNRHDEARNLLTEARAQFERIGDRRGVLAATATQGAAAARRGDFDGALAAYESCRQQASSSGDQARAAKFLQNLADIYGRRQQWQESLDAGRECIRRNAALGNRYTLMHALWNLPDALFHQDQPENAARLMAFIAPFWVKKFGPLTSEDAADCDEFWERVTATLGPARTATLREDGARLSLSDAVALALQDVEKNS